jgi:hypothetical protein
MTDYSYVASYDVRKVLWEELQNAGIFDINDYYADGFADPLIPIIPAQQVPEFNNLLPGQKYLTYDVMAKFHPVQWWMSEETMTFEVVSRDAEETQTIMNFMIDLFRRYDQSARDINLQLVEGSPFTFHFFRIESADPIQAFQNEGGFTNSPFVIDYSYSRELDPITGRYL